MGADMKKPEKPRVERIALDLEKVKAATPVLVTRPDGKTFHYGKANLAELARGGQ